MEYIFISHPYKVSCLSPVPTIILINMYWGRSIYNHEELMGLIEQEKGDLSQVPIFPSAIVIPLRDIIEIIFPLGF
jgi:hypothetical protein